MQRRRWWGRRQRSLLRVARTQRELLAVVPPEPDAVPYAVPDSVPDTAGARRTVRWRLTPLGAGERHVRFPGGGLFQHHGRPLVHGGQQRVQHYGCGYRYHLRLLLRQGTDAGPDTEPDSCADTIADRLANSVPDRIANSVPDRLANTMHCG